jgi:hypothetical protein
MMEAESLIRRGQVRQGEGYAAAGLADIKEGFELYFRRTDANDRALPGWQALYRALTCEEATETGKHRELARSAWTAIGRLDLVHDWIDRQPSPG